MRLARGGAALRSVWSLYNSSSCQGQECYEHRKGSLEPLVPGNPREASAQSHIPKTDPDSLETKSKSNRRKEAWKEHFQHRITDSRWLRAGPTSITSLLPLFEIIKVKNTSLKNCNLENKYAFCSAPGLLSSSSQQKASFASLCKKTGRAKAAAGQTMRWDGGSPHGW